MHLRLFTTATLLLFVAAPLLTAGENDGATRSPTIDFARDVQPIFAARCERCHGAKKAEGGLRLDRRADVLAGGDRGPAFVAGKSAESRLIRFVAGLDPDFTMPPGGK